MKVFISWSGPLSRQVAEVIRLHLPLMLQDTEPFLSSHDIASGDRWATELAQSLESSNFGLICLTQDNLTSSWLLFEAGALTKHSQGSVCCLLLGDLSLADVKPPLSQFQNRTFNKTEMRTLLRDINSRLPRPLGADQLEMVFDRWWPELEARYDQAMRDHTASTSDVPKRRATEDILDEVLLTVRELARGRVASSIASDDPLAMPIGEASLANYTRNKSPHLGVSEYWQRRLLDDIDRSRYPTLRHVDDAVEAAKPALDAYSNVAPSTFSTGTDFITKALGFVDPEFRSRHAFGVQTRRAFEQYAGLLVKSEAQ